MPTNEKSIAWYNEHAEEYTAHVRNPQDSIYHSLYEKPAMYGMLPDVSGKKVLSLGCGSGEDCRYLKEIGASEVVGIDISEELIKIAAESYPNVQFSVMDMEKLGFPNESFDLLYSSLALHYVEDWRLLMKEAYRVLRPGGIFQFSCNHPVYSSFETVINTEHQKKAELSRTKNKDTDTVEIRGNYMARKSMTMENGLAVTTWHKPIGEIASEVAQAGFIITQIVEPQPLPAMQELSPSNYETLTKIPNFVLFQLRK